MVLPNHHHGRVTLASVRRSFIFYVCAGQMISVFSVIFEKHSQFHAYLVWCRKTTGSNDSSDQSYSACDATPLTLHCLSCPSPWIRPHETISFFFYSSCCCLGNSSPVKLIILQISTAPGKHFTLIEKRKKKQQLIYPHKWLLMLWDGFLNRAWRRLAQLETRVVRGKSNNTSTFSPRWSHYWGSLRC